jgi:hypothetical protein
MILRIDTQDEPLGIVITVTDEKKIVEPSETHEVIDDLPELQLEIVKFK